MKNTKPLVTLLVISLLCFLFVGLFGFHSFKDSLIESKKEDVATILKIARNQSTVYIDQYKQGLLTKEQADNKIIELLSAMRYESAYIWANDDFGIARVHARKEVVGQFQQSYVEHMSQLAGRDLFFLTQVNVKPITDERIYKTNGITKIPEWNWVIGFGFYMDDIHKTVFHAEILFIFSVVISMLVVSLFTLYWIRQAKQS